MSALLIRIFLIQTIGMPSRMVLLSFLGNDISVKKLPDSTLSAAVLSSAIQDFPHDIKLYNSFKNMQHLNHKQTSHPAPQKCNFQF